jgi:hypothetical protein
MIAGHVSERMALGRENVYPNWFLDDDHDIEWARVFIHRSCDDEAGSSQVGPSGTAGTKAAAEQPAEDEVIKRPRVGVCHGAEVRALDSQAEGAAKAVIDLGSNHLAGVLRFARHARKRTPTTPSATIA